MSPEKFKLFIADIKSRGLQKPIEVVVETLDCKLVKTIIDGHHRYKACKTAGIKDYDISFEILDQRKSDVNYTQVRKEYIFRSRDLRNEWNTYQRVTSALNIFSFNTTDKDIAGKLGIDRSTVTKIKLLNQKCESFTFSYPETISKYKLELETKGNWGEILKAIEGAEKVDEIIIARTSGNLAHRKELQEKYKTLKFEKNAIKKIEDEFKEKETGPEPESTPYLETVNKVSEKIVQLVQDFPEQAFYIKWNTAEEKTNYTSGAEITIKDSFVDGLLPTKKVYAIIALEIPELKGES